MTEELIPGHMAPPRQLPDHVEQQTPSVLSTPLKKYDPLYWHPVRQWRDCRLPAPSPSVAMHIPGVESCGRDVGSVQGGAAVELDATVLGRAVVELDATVLAAGRPFVEGERGERNILQETV